MKVKQHRKLLKSQSLIIITDDSCEIQNDSFNSYSLPSLTGRKNVKTVNKDVCNVEKWNYQQSLMA